jgi:transcriptional regulator with XRE-family HTH domain
MDAGRQLDALMRRRHLSQTEVAAEAGVSQGTVSRVLRRTPERSGRAYRRLCIYIQQEEQHHDTEPREVFDAVRRIWDGSEGHAAALVELIVASRRLWPELAERAEESRSTAQSNSERD